MSTAQATPVALNPTIAAVNSNVLAFTPAVMAGVMAAEQSGADGATKQQAVVNAVLGTSGVLESNTNPNVAGIAGLVNLVLSIFNATGIFSHKKAVAATTASA